MFAFLIYWLHFAQSRYPIIVWPRTQHLFSSTVPCKKSRLHKPCTWKLLAWSPKGREFPHLLTYKIYKVWMIFNLYGTKAAKWKTTFNYYNRKRKQSCSAHSHITIPHMHNVVYITLLDYRRNMRQKLSSSFFFFMSIEVVIRALTPPRSYSIKLHK